MQRRQLDVFGGETSAHSTGQQRTRVFISSTAARPPRERRRHRSGGMPVPRREVVVHHGEVAKLRAGATGKQKQQRRGCVVE